MQKIKENVIFVGSIDWDRRLFDELIPLPDGTSYNSYLVKGSEKTALIDTVDPPKVEELTAKLVGLGISKIDYIISHHAEQDHSGSLPDVLMLYPDAKVVTNPKCKQMLIDLLCIEEDRFVTVEDGQTLSLGDKTLEFVYTPWVHWPETMGTYLQEDNIFFSCDFFGSHLAASNLFVENERVVYEAAKRYYAEIMMPFRNQIKKNLERIKGLKIDIIAPSHGPVYDKPRFIIEAYKDWTGDKVKNEVVIPYVSMHESTKAMVKHLTEVLIEKGVTVKEFNLTETDIGKLAVSLVDAATIVIGSPTVLTGAHPAAAYAAFLANALRPKTKCISIIGSYGWAGKMVEQLASLIPNIKAEILEPVVIKGYPKEQDFMLLEELAEKIVQKHAELGVIKD
jgi:flavorubredoxin